MSDFVTLHIPAEVMAEVEIDTNFDASDTMPLFTSGYGANPDEFSLAIYADYSTLNIENNVRANLLIDVCSPPDMENWTISGDCYLVCPEDLAKKFIDNDQKFHGQIRLDRAFKAWMRGYAEDNSLDVVDVLGGVANFLSHMESLSRRSFATDLAQKLGLNPEQVEVIVL